MKNKINYSYDEKQKKVNEKHLSMNISHSLFLFRRLVSSAKQLLSDTRNNYNFDGNQFIDSISNIRHGFRYIFEYIINQLISYKASNSSFQDQTIREETKQKLIEFKDKYGGIFYDALFADSAIDASIIDTMYNEFDQILTEENNKIIYHSYNHPWDK